MESDSENTDFPNIRQLTRKIEWLVYKKFFLSALSPVFNQISSFSNAYEFCKT